MALFHKTKYLGSNQVFGYGWTEYPNILSKNGTRFDVRNDSFKIIK